MAQLGGQGQQIIILPEGTSRLLGRDAQRMNIMAGKALAGIVRTTLGPKGMDKMLVDGMGDIVVTNDGVTILREMDILAEKFFVSQEHRLTQCTYLSA